MATNGQFELLVAQPKHDIPAHEPRAKTTLKVDFLRKSAFLWYKYEPHAAGVEAVVESHESLFSTNKNKIIYQSSKYR